MPDEKEIKEIKQEKKVIIENLGKVQDIRIEEEVQKSYIDYAMSVIVSRALPDAADGLKPVQRRILFAMHEMSLHSDKPTRKSARIVGDVIGKFHPHGDIPVYDALSRMTQDFSLRYPLVTGQGNFGSIDGDPPAAMRYTEAKLSQLAEEMLADIEKETVDFRANFDNSLKEPVLLPAKIPNLLVNGASGIAVGMATSIPPHNLSEIIESLIELIKNPNTKIEKLIEIVQGPDFPTAGFIAREGIEDFYKTGRGYITVRGKTGIEEAKGRERVVITEIPFQVNKSSLVEEIARLVKDKKLQDISDIRDESSKKIRIILELKRGANSKITINQLFNLTSMQTRFNGIMLALVDNTPRILNLKEMLEEFLKHRKNVITRRSKFELRVARDRAHIVEGLLVILGSIDKAIETIKKSKDSRDALQNLMNKFKLSQKQSESVLDMRLGRLTALEHGKLKNEQQELQVRIKELEKILGNEIEVLDIVRKELQELRRKHADERRTKFLEKIPTFKEKDLITKEQVVILLTAKGYIKRMPLRVYKEQQRGGRGVTGTELTTGDIVKDVFIASTHDFLLFVTNKGKAYSTQAYEIPEAERYAKGKALVNMLNLKDEKIATTLSISSFEGSLVLITKKGMAKRMDLKNFEKIRVSGIVAINLPQDDELVCAKFISKGDEIIIGTARGIAIHFSSDQIREVGRTAYGVTAIRMHKEDYVIGAEVLSQEKERQEKLAVLVITEKGFGKRTVVSRYRKTARGGKGVRHIKINDKMGNVSGLLTVRNEDSLIVTTSRGMTIRTPIKNMRLAGRMTQGVRIIKIADNDKVIGLSKVSDEQ